MSSTEGQTLTRILSDNGLHTAARAILQRDERIRELAQALQELRDAVRDVRADSDELFSPKGRRLLTALAMSDFILDKR